MNHSPLPDFNVLFGCVERGGGAGGRKMVNNFSLWDTSMQMCLTEEGGGAGRGVLPPAICWFLFFLSRVSVRYFELCVCVYIYIQGILRTQTFTFLPGQRRERGKREGARKRVVLP